MGTLYTLEISQINGTTSSASRRVEVVPVTELGVAFIFHISNVFHNEVLTMPSNLHLRDDGSRVRVISDRQLLHNDLLDRVPLLVKLHCVTTILQRLGMTAVWVLGLLYLT